MPRPSAGDPGGKFPRRSELAGSSCRTLEDCSRPSGYERPGLLADRPSGRVANLKTCPTPDHSLELSAGSRWLLAHRLCDTAAKRARCSQLFSYEYTAKVPRAYGDFRSGSICWFRAQRRIRAWMMPENSPGAASVRSEWGHRTGSRRGRATGAGTRAIPPGDRVGSARNARRE